MLLWDLAVNKDRNDIMENRTGSINLLVLRASWNHVIHGPSSWEWMPGALGTFLPGHVIIIMVFPQLILLLLIKTGSNLPPYNIDPPESRHQLTLLGNNGGVENGFICYLLSFEPNAEWRTIMLIGSSLASHPSSKDFGPLRLPVQHFSCRWFRAVIEGHMCCQAVADGKVCPDMGFLCYHTTASLDITPGSPGRRMQPLQILPFKSASATTFGLLVILSAACRFKSDSINNSHQI